MLKNWFQISKNRVSERRICQESVSVISKRFSETILKLRDVAAVPVSIKTAYTQEC